MLVGTDKAVYDVRFKFIGEIEHIVRHIQLMRHISGILHIIEGTAGMLSRHADFIVGKQLHGDAYTVKTVLFHQICRYGRVHTSAHGNNCFLFHIYRNLVFLSVLKVYALCFFLSTGQIPSCQNAEVFLIICLFRQY